MNRATMHTVETNTQTYYNLHSYITNFQGNWVGYITNDAAVDSPVLNR
jgi:hypothetical protein